MVRLPFSMGFGRGSRSRERKDIPPSSVRESCVVRGANNEDEYTFRNAAIDDGEPPFWVKPGKAQNEQMFSAPPHGNCETRFAF